MRAINNRPSGISSTKQHKLDQRCVPLPTTSERADIMAARVIKKNFQSEVLPRYKHLLLAGGNRAVACWLRVLSVFPYTFTE